MSRASPSHIQKAAAVPQQAPAFEVEIQTGNRAKNVEAPATGRANAAKAGSALASQRRQAARRRLWVGICALALALGLAVWSTAAWWQPLLTGDVLVRVNGQPITYQQLDKELRLSKALSVARTGKAEVVSAPAMLEQLILLELEAQAARQANFTVSQQDVDGEIAKIIQQDSITSGKLDGVLSTYGLTHGDLHASLDVRTLTEQFAQRRVALSATDPELGLARISQWQTDLAQKARIERVRNPAVGIGPQVGTQAPDFTLKQIGGQQVSLSSLRGTTVVIYVWSPWCPACRAEAPILEKAYQAQASNGSASGRFEILAVTAQNEQTNVNAFIQEFGLTFPVFIDAQGEVADLYQVFDMPALFFIDKAGVIRAIHTGQIDDAALRQNLDAAR